MSRKKITIDALFSKRLRELIENVLKIKREEFRDKIGISTGYLAMVLTGARGPSAELIAGLFIHYRDYLYWLLTGEGDPYTCNSINTKTIEEVPTIEMLSMASAILESRTVYSESLAANIKSSFKALELEKRTSTLENKYEQLTKKLNENGKRTDAHGVEGQKGP